MSERPSALLARVAAGTEEDMVADVVGRYALALEAALVTVTKSLDQHRRTMIRRQIGIRLLSGDEAMALAAPLISQIPAPQKEPR